jgi:hypothetical protein
VALLTCTGRAAALATIMDAMPAAALKISEDEADGTEEIATGNNAR